MDKHVEIETKEEIKIDYVDNLVEIGNNVIMDNGLIVQENDLNIQSNEDLYNPLFKIEKEEKFTNDIDIILEETVDDVTNDFNLEEDLITISKNIENQFLKPIDSIVQISELKDTICNLEQQEHVFLCPTCGKSYNNKCSYYYHIKVTHKPKGKNGNDEICACEICGAKCKGIGNLKRHLKIHDPKNPHICIICDKKFSFKAHLDMHMHMHKGTKPLKCKICGQGAVHKEALKTHMRFHTGEKPFACTKCDARFYSSSHLRSHEKQHINKVYCCELCNKEYRSLRTFQKHKKSHDPSKWYNCEFCDKTFSDSRRRNVHMQKHSEYKPIICPICEKSLLNSTQLDIHMRIKHTSIE